MLLWMGLAVLAAAVTYAVTRPLIMRQSQSEPAAEQSPDASIYKDQLREIEADAERGLISASEAKAARTEVARRLLASTGASETAPANASIPKSRTVLHTALSISIPITSLLAYLTLGEPTLPSRPYAERMATPIKQATAGDLIARVEAQLREHPEDGRGWDVIAPIYLRSARYPEAAEAYLNAIKLLGETPDRIAGYADARVGQENGIIPDDALKAYERLAALAPDRFDAKFRIALAKEQDGKLNEAIADLKALIATAPADAPWRAAVERRMQIMEAKASGKPIPPEAIGNEQRATLSQFVTELGNQLKANPGDLNIWVQLARAHKLLGDSKSADSTIEGARKQFAGDSKSLELINKLAESLKAGT